MRLTFAFCLFFLSASLNCLQAQNFEGYTQHPLPKFECKVKITNDVRMWFDSLHYRFLIVDFTDIPTNLAHSEKFNFRGPYYSYFDGPVFLKDDKNCTIYPMYSEISEIDSSSQTKSIQAYFGLDDLKMLSDSVTVYCLGYNGYANQSQMNSMHLLKKLKVQPKWTFYEEDKSYPLATEKWFQKWRKDNWGDDHTRIWYLDKRHYCP